MACAVVSFVLDRLAAIILENARQIGIEQEIQKLQTNLKAIQCTLEDEDAEPKQTAQKSVRLWLENLQDLSYDIEDVLDEWNTAMLRLKIDEAENVYFCRKVCSCFSWVATCYPGILPDITAKIKEINKKLDVIANEKDMHQFARSSEIKQPRRLESTSFTDVSELYGRDEVKNMIVSTLLGGNEIKIIGIAGMGGIGKTTLAEAIFNDSKVRAHFNHVIWVSLSDLFDQNRIATAILRVLNQDSNYVQKPTPLQDVWTRIRYKTKRSKFLLVLDDVWIDRDENWEQLKAVFQQGRPGSRVLLTTRKGSIATGMGCSQVFTLNELSNEICWQILSQVAFVGKDNDLCGNLEDIGREIAKKCRGLPLAAKTLGGLLRDKKSRNEWQNVLNSEKWKLNVAEEYVYTPLLLNYHDLPSKIRSCLLYCAVFPKDFVYDRDELIKHWMSHGYLNSDENFGMEEEKGEEYFNCLASRSFFHDFKKDGSGKIIQCKMHHLIHDFVRYLTNEVVEVEFNSSENARLDLCSKKARHLRVMIADMDKFPVFINGIEKLRSLVVIGQKCYVTREAMEALLKAGKCLRILDFHLCSWRSLKVKEIPNGIGELIHLRYLNLSCSEHLEELPEVVCELCNLLHLNLFGCNHLKKLPDGIGKLINLKYLNTWGCVSLIYHPKGIGRLISLRELTFVQARIDGKNAKEFSIGDMEKLDLLRGSVKMKLVGNVADLVLEETKRAKLHKKIHLSRLIILLRVGKASDGCEAIRKALNLPGNVEFSYEWLSGYYLGDN